jgi:hypothetical protein
MIVKITHSKFFHSTHKQERNSQDKSQNIRLFVQQGLPLDFLVE